MNSHIIPEFVYRSHYDSKHRFRSAQIDQAKWEWEQKGFREPMLCSDCERRLSRYEKHASEEFFKRPLPSPILAPKGASAFEIKGLDYKLMKLFLLSFLWRAGVAQHEFYQHVKLKKHAKHIRKMLLAESPGHPEQYACVICTLKLDGVSFDGFFVGPTPSRLSDQRVYRFVFGGFVFFFFVSSQPVPKLFKSLALRKDGSIRILDSELADHPFLCDVFNKAKEAFGSREWD